MDATVCHLLVPSLSFLLLYNANSIPFSKVLNELQHYQSPDRVAPRYDLSDPHTMQDYKA